MENRFKIEPVSKSQQFLLYSDETMDAARGTIGRLRFDFGKNGNEFWFTWFPHNGDRLNTSEFKDEFDCVVNYLRSPGKPLSNFRAVKQFRFADGSRPVLLPNPDAPSYAIKIETDNYIYYVRLETIAQQYNYIYCYSKAARSIGKKAEHQRDVCYA